MYAVKIIADSISPSGCRITTVTARFPRFILAEVNTHGKLARSSASSRARPTKKAISTVLYSPFVPDFAENKKGMSAGKPLSWVKNKAARVVWRLGALGAVLTSSALDRLNVHKQWASRPLEPFAWHEAIVTATDWDNFFNLRISEKAQPEFCAIATLIRDTIAASTPRLLEVGDWHLPYGGTKEESTGRCARVSYLTHDGRIDPVADKELHDRLLDAGHMAPFDHPAQCQEDNKSYGRFTGWKPYRQFIPGEADILGFRRRSNVL